MNPSIYFVRAWHTQPNIYIKVYGLKPIIIKEDLYCKIRSLFGIERLEGGGGFFCVVTMTKTHQDQDSIMYLFGRLLID